MTAVNNSNEFERKQRLKVNDVNKASLLTSEKVTYAIVIGPKLSKLK